MASAKCFKLPPVAETIQEALKTAERRQRTEPVTKRTPAQHTDPKREGATAPEREGA